VLSERSGPPGLHGLRWQVVVAGVGALILLGFLLQSAAAYETVLVPAAGGTLVEAMVGGPRYINPLLAAFNRVDADISALVFSGLTRLDGCGNVLPDLAESWEISADGLSYTFHLRPDAAWQDGVPLLSRDVLFTIGLIQSPDFPGPEPLRRFWRDVRAELLDDHTIRFVLPAPYAPFLAHTTLGILPEHLLKGVSAAGLTELEFNRLPIGSGPYKVIESDVAHVVLSRNELYYGEKPLLEEVEFRFFRDYGEALRALELGQVMSLAQVPAELLPRAAGLEGVNLYSAPLSRLVLVLLNLQNQNAPFLSEQPVRQALLYGLDREALVLRVLEGRGLVAHAPYASCSWALNPKGATYAYDLPRAKDLLEAAGWVDQDGDGTRERDGTRLQLNLFVIDDRSLEAVAREIARQWLALGVQTTVVPLPFTELVGQALEQHRFDAALIEVALGGDPDPYVLWHSSQVDEGQNYGSFVDREADALLQQARQQWSQAERQAMYYRFQEIFAAQLPALPLYYPVYTYAVSKGVRGVELGPLIEPGDRFRYLAKWYVNFRRLRVRQPQTELGE
jgi:peptide/nickel transport system substrate-binding protein